MKIIGIIPARMASERFPNKPMELIHGMPMIGHVYKRSLLCKDIDYVCVTTCDNEIYEYIKSINGNVIYTNSNHNSTVESSTEALLKVEQTLKFKFDIVVIIQGDEPMINSEMIGNSLSPLIMNDDINVVSLMSEIKTIKEFNNVNVVKVVVDINNFALYFSREAIPSNKKGVLGFPKLKKVNVIPFRRNFLLEFNDIPQTPLEIVEGINLLRLMESGMKVKMVMSDTETYSVDIEEDLELVRKKMKDDLFMKKYL
jgi:3-deoxy-manno-octulosonate cytidylyltransferase (CMP-KDO synthetase)